MSDKYDWIPSAWPNFSAWCDDEQRIEAFVAALSMLIPAEGLCSVAADNHDWPDLSVADAAQRIRAEYVSHAYVHAFFTFKGALGRSLELAASVFDDSFLRRGLGVIEISSGLQGYLFPNRVHLGKKHRSHLVEAAAAVACHIAMADMQDILLRLCTPHPGITTGGCHGDAIWGAPIAVGASYHVDRCVGRDLALSWIHLHDRERLELAAGLPLDTLRERVEAAPRGATVSIRDRGVLTREQILAALALGADELLEALETAAVPDEEWLAVEPLALHALESEAHGAHTVEVHVFTEPHVRFIQQHAPFQVHRLPNGGVLLATHPYRTLWQLWADALLLLGIRTNETDPPA